MSSTSKAQGFVPVASQNGDMRPSPFNIASGYAANIFTGDPVRLNTSGVIVLATSDGTRAGTTDGIPVLGIFGGCQYVDATGAVVNSPNWPTGQTLLGGLASNAVGYVYNGRDTLMRVQYTNPSPGTTVQAAIGQQADWVPTGTGGSTFTGLSSTQLTALQATRGQFIIRGFEKNQADLLTDTYVTALVQFNEQNFNAAVNVVS